MNTTIADTILNTVINKRKKPISYEEYQYFNKEMKKIDMNMFKDHDIDIVINTISDVMIDAFRKNVYSQNLQQVDIHSYLAKEIGSSAEVSDKKSISDATTVNSLLTSPLVLQRIFNPEAIKRKTYLIMDSRYRNRVGDYQTNFQWNIASIGQLYDSTTSAVSSSTIHDVVNIKVFPFRFPNTSYALNDMHRISIEFVELNSQSLIAPYYNKRFHVEFDVESTTSSQSPYELVDIGESTSQFTFYTPIVELTLLTVRFGNPFLTLTLDPDQLNANLSANGSQTVIDFGVTNHLCASGDYITVLTFTTSQPAVDNTIINNILNPNGWQTVAATSTTMTIAFDLSTLTGTITNPCEIYLNAKRFVIRAEVTYLTNT